MDVTTIDFLAKMGADLAALAVKGTATAIHSKMESIKKESNADRLRNTYDEIVNQILSEREEAIRIAQGYREELEKVVISEDDIKHLHATVEMVLDIFKEIAPQNDTIESFEQLKVLISIDVFKTMQLIGFNYKAAIGEPLTKLCADAILKLANRKVTTKK